MHPLDLVKTRFQIQRGPEDPNRYTSIVDCFRKMYRNEGYALQFNLFIFLILFKKSWNPSVHFATYVAST